MGWGVSECGGQAGRGDPVSRGINGSHDQWSSVTLVSLTGGGGTPTQTNHVLVVSAGSKKANSAHQNGRYTGIRQIQMVIFKSLFSLNIHAHP